MSQEATKSEERVPQASRSLRVLHIVPAPFNSDGVIGGAERYALELAKSMACVVPTTLASFSRRSSKEKIGPLTVRILGNSWYVKGERTNPVSLRLFREIWKADVIHCHQRRVLTSSLAALFGRLIGRRVFVSDLGGGGWDISYHLSTEHWYKKHLHISEYSRQIFGHAGKPWAEVILGGVDTERFSPDASVTRDGVVRFVGRLLPHKGVDILVSAVTPEMPLELIGKPYSPEYLLRLQDLARNKQVAFNSECDDTSLVRAYRKALCVVLPSVYKDINGNETTIPELLGQTLLEAMACGTPVICSDVASMPEIVEDGVTGFVVPANDAEALRARIQWLQNHPEQSRQMGVAARQRVCDDFTWAHVVQRCLDAYTA